MKEIYFFCRYFFHYWRANQIQMRASALTYNFILALIPAIAVCVFLLTFFVDFQGVSTNVQSFILKNLAAGTNTIVINYLQQVIVNVKLKAIGYVGLGALIFTAYILIAAVEDAVNRIWRIRRKKNFAKRLFIYVSLFILGISSIALSTAAAPLIKRMAPHLLLKANAGVVFFNALFIFCVFKILPNTRVKNLPCLTASIVTAVFSELGKWGYTLYVAKALIYNKVYGSLAAVPLFLIWIYVNWTIFLAGAQLNYLLQNYKIVREFRKGRPLPVPDAEGELPVEAAAVEAKIENAIAAETSKEGKA